MLFGGEGEKETQRQQVNGMMKEVGMLAEGKREMGQGDEAKRLLEHALSTHTLNCEDH